MKFRLVTANFPGIRKFMKSKILTKGDLKLRQAAIVRAESRHRNIAPNNISLPILKNKF